MIRKPRRPNAKFGIIHVRPANERVEHYYGPDKDGIIYVKPASPRVERRKRKGTIADRKKDVKKSRL